jgi:hypothetical protein
MAVEMVGDSLAIRRPTEFSITNLDSGETTKLEFSSDGVVVRQAVSSMRDLTAPTQRNPGQVVFLVDRWVCKCWLLTENWCSHIASFFERNGDTDKIREICDIQQQQMWRGDTPSLRTLKYPMAHGLVLVGLVLQGFPEKDILGEGDGMVHSLVASEDVYLWLAGGESGMMLIRQIEEIVKASPRYEFWHEAAFMLKRFRKCLNSRHNVNDTRNFLDQCRDTEGDHDKLEDIAFMNTYYEVFYDRCKSCFDFMQNVVGKDVPQF